MFFPHPQSNGSRMRANQALNLLKSALVIAIWKVGY